MIEINVLVNVLNKIFDKKIRNANYQIKKLHGGIIGNVNLITGIAETFDGEKLPYEVVLKIQKIWERPGDSNSWRREFDLCLSDFKDVFFESFSWAECYYADMNINGNETQIWMEYIDGVSGKNLTIEMLERASFELGRFQSRLYKQHSHLLIDISNLSKVEDVKDYYTIERMQTPEYIYIHSDKCEIPEHLRNMLINIDNETESIFANHNNMPLVLCHRDFWVENVFYVNGKIVLLDWDSIGWGFMFEDVIQLITDSVDISYLDYFPMVIAAYLKGFAECTDISMIANEYIWKMLIIKAGYGPVNEYISAKSIDEKNKWIDILQKMYNYKNVEFIKNS